MVPHVREHPLALHSFPQGVGGPGYFVKDRPKHFPDWVPTVAVPKREGGTIHQVLANDAATLVYLAGQNVITPHAGSRPRRPARAPGPPRVRPRPLDRALRRGARDGARLLGDLLRDIGLAPFAMTTGSRGAARRRAAAPHRRLRRGARLHPRGRRGARRRGPRPPHDRAPPQAAAASGSSSTSGATPTASTRSRPTRCARAPDAPVATPLRWEELDDEDLDPQGWTIQTIGARLADGGDPWAGMGRHARALGPAQKALARRAS